MDGMAVVVRLSNHFQRRWRERVGGVPELAEINEILEHGLRVREQMKGIFQVVGGKQEPVNVLALYWSPAQQVIIWVDMDRQVAVTVISARAARSIKRGAERGT